MTVHRRRRVLMVCAVIVILAGCRGGSFSPAGSALAPGAENVGSTGSAMHTDAPPRKSTITVMWENTKQPVADAVVKLGWGKNCGLLECSSYQKSGRSGGKGRIVFMNLPSEKINWCVYATKLNSTSISCDATHDRPIDSAITIELAKS
jgi:hypothetical protein